MYMLLILFILLDIADDNCFQIQALIIYDLKLRSNSR